MHIHACKYIFINETDAFKKSVICLMMWDLAILSIKFITHMFWYWKDEQCFYALTGSKTKMSAFINTYIYRKMLQYTDKPRLSQGRNPRWIINGLCHPSLVGSLLMVTLMVRETKNHLSYVKRPQGSILC